MRARIGEAVAIVLSILAAFAIDASWDEWKERGEEAEVLHALRDEFEVNVRRLRAHVDMYDRTRRDFASLSRMTPADIRALDQRRISELHLAIAQPWSFDAALSTTETLIGGGRTDLIRDEHLRRLLNQFVTTYGDTREDVDFWVVPATWRVYDRMRELGGPWFDADVEKGSSDTGLAGLDFMGPISADQLATLRSDSTILRLGREFHWNARYYANELETLLGVAEEILGRLPPAGSGDAMPGTPADTDLAVLLNPDHPAWSEAAPDSFDAVVETTAGEFRMRVVRAWAPIGVDRFWNLARHGFYDDARLHRVVPGFITQFGISGRPDVDAVWYERGMPDDPVVASNVRGAVAYAFTEPGTRATQLYVNMVDNVRLDSTGFAPIGRIVVGMESVVDSIFGGYGEDSGGGVRRGNQAPLVEGGNAFIDAEWPELDRIVRVTIEAARGDVGRGGLDAGGE